MLAYRRRSSRVSTVADDIIPTCNPHNPSPTTIVRILRISLRSITASLSITKKLKLLNVEYLTSDKRRYKASPYQKSKTLHKNILDIQGVFMKIARFILVGENIHCSRSYKVDGPNVKKVNENKYAIVYRRIDNQQALLPVSAHFVNSSEWQSGKAKHCSIAIWMGLYGSPKEKSMGADYIKSLAHHQEQNEASYLDINVDEFSQNLDEQLKAISWTVDIVQSASKLPVSIDSSNCKMLEAGLKLCEQSRGRPMVNSVSLERIESIKIAKKYNAVVIASAAGEKGLPSGVDDRLNNIEKLIHELLTAGFKLNDIHVDPLVLPISTDTNNGKIFLDTVTHIREKYGSDIHIVAGLSNVSFGLPNRKFINQVFAHLAIKAGADGGILDPSQVNLKILNSIDTTTEAYTITKEMLLGNDEFCTNFIISCREGKI